jgi:hypothetical protein
MKEKIMIQRLLSMNVFLNLCLNVLMMFFVMTFSSCVRYDKLVKSEFPQGTSYDDNRDVTYYNVRSANLYEQFETKGIFNALHLSDGTRTKYVDVYTRKRGIMGASYKAMLNRNLEENKHWISFYLLADIRDKTYVSLSEKNSSWSLYLDMGNGVTIAPESIKEVDIEPEYQAFFGYRFNLFKAAYLVKFPIQDAAGKRYEGDDVDLKLVISSPYKKCELEWKNSDKKAGKKTGETSDQEIEQVLGKDEDFYWG